jgi:hypothetical protein
MEFLIFVVNVLAIGALAFKVWRKSSDRNGLFWTSLLIKLVAGIALGLIYKYYYSVGDTFILFNQAKEQAQIFYHQPAAFLDFLLSKEGEEWKGHLRSSFFVKIISIFNVLTASNYWITGLWFSFIAFLGAWQIFNCIARNFKESSNAAAMAFLFFPSVVFWSSGIIKESLALAGLYVLANLWLKCMMKEKIVLWEWMTSLLGLWILWNLKYYWAAIFVPVAIVSLVIRSSGTRLISTWKYPAWICLIVAAGVGIQFIHPNFYPGYFLIVLVDNHNAFIPISNPDNLIHYYNLTPVWTSILLNTPLALFSGFFRPLPGEVHGIMAWVPALENVLVLILFLSSLNLGKIFSSPHRLMTFSVLTYSFILCIFLAISTPNFGSLARYKVGFIPFFIFLISYGNPVVGWVIRKFNGKIEDQIHGRVI